MTATFTGDPFCDAGLSAICAAVSAHRPENLGAADLKQASQAIDDVLLSDAALGVGTDRSFARSALGRVFPNSPLVNPSNWRGLSPEDKVQNVRSKFRARLQADLEKAVLALEMGLRRCPVCGSMRPAESFSTLRKAEKPLLSGIVNYYSGWRAGVDTCGLCAFSLWALPFSILRSAGGAELWFIHCMSPDLPVEVSRRFGWEHLRRLATAGKPLDFYGAWGTVGREASILSLLAHLLEDALVLRGLYESKHPVSAIVFGNDNRGGSIRRVGLPHHLLRFMAQLHLESASAYRAFWTACLRATTVSSSKDGAARARQIKTVARSILEGESILRFLLRDDPPSVFGGWVGHRAYLKEVRQMEVEQLWVTERLGRKLAEDKDVKRNVAALRGEPREVRRFLLQLVDDGLLSFEEYDTLVRPKGDVHIAEVRDALLAAIYEDMSCRERGEQFQALASSAPPTKPDEFVARLEAIGTKSLSALPNVGQWIGRLRVAENPIEIRGAYLWAMERGALSWPDYIFLVPPRGVNPAAPGAESAGTAVARGMGLYERRDYLLAFLFDRTQVDESAKATSADLEGTSEG